MRSILFLLALLALPSLALAQTQVHGPFDTNAAVNPLAPQGTPASAFAIYKSVTYAAPAASVVAVGGTAVTALVVGSIVHGFDLQNPPTATEVLYYSLVGPAGTAVSGSTFGLAAGASFHGDGTAQALSVNAATSGHAFAAASD